MDHDVTDLGHLSMVALVENVAKTIGADDRTGMDANASADDGAGVNCDVWRQSGAFANLRVGANVVIGLEHSGCVDSNALTYHAKGTDVSRWVDSRGGMDDGGGMDAGRIFRFRKK